MTAMLGGVDLSPTTIGVPNLGLGAVTQPVAAGENAVHSQNAPPHPPIVR